MKPETSLCFLSPIYLQKQGQGFGTSCVPLSTKTRKEFGTSCVPLQNDCKNSSQSCDVCFFEASAASPIIRLIFSGSASWGWPVGERNPPTRQLAGVDGHLGFTRNKSLCSMQRSCPPWLSLNEHLESKHAGLSHPNTLWKPFCRDVQNPPAQTG